MYGFILGLWLLVTPPQQDCGGWENWLDVVVTQEIDSSKCLHVSSTLGEPCYNVQVQIFPGPPEQCTFMHCVTKSRVNKVIKKYVEQYL